MYGKFLFCILLGVLAIHAQGNAGGSVLKAGRKSVRAARASEKLVTSPEIASEALRLSPSVVGMGNYAQNALRFYRLKRVIPTPMIRHFEHFPWGKPPMEAFVVKFQSRFIDPVKEEAFLHQKYGELSKFEGHFVSSFMEVNKLSNQAVKYGTTAGSALQKAISEGVQKRAGFLTVAIAGNGHRPKDVLIYNVSGKNWISINQSKAEYLRTHREEMRDSFKENNLYWDHLLESQGVIIRPDNYEMPQRISVSLNGLTWQELDVSEPMGAQLWNAWNQSLFIQYDRHTRTAKFAADKESVLFSSAENAVAFREARSAGITSVENADGTMTYFFNAERLPNMFVRLNNGELKSMQVAKLTVGEYFPMSPVEFIEELQKLSASVLKADPSRRLIFLEEVAEKGDFYEAEDCVHYLSKDGSVTLPDLQDLQEFERINETR